MKVCSVAGCEGRVRAKGLCRRHYQQKWRTGSEVIARPNPHGSVEERFWRYVSESDPASCWPWTGRKDKDGYGTLRVGESMRRAHVLSWVLHFGQVAPLLLVLHRCNNPSCVNPAHLKMGTHLDNMADRLAADHYPRGDRHPMAKVTEDQVAEIHAALGTYAEIGRRFGLSASQVGNIRRGTRKWKP